MPLNLALHHRPPRPHRRLLPLTPELISAVDISCDGRPIYSKVLVTETSSPWFLCTPFRLDLLDPKETVATPLDPGGGACAARAADRLRVSWILIDPAAGRAASVASRRAVVARRHWLTGDLQLRYAVVVDAGGGRLAECAVAVACRCGGGGGMRVVEVSMQVVGVEGRVLAGMEGLGVIQAAMEAGRTRPSGSGGGGWERDVYAAFARMKARCREGKEKREKGLDTACVATGIAIFVAFFVFLLSR
ncbi:F-box protein [Striga hermonthica]|uniref:F-box protein n=1 Tax=Striga hermonthica TaxID=68872 RepID=A0A9N7NSK4_STRHE|nr:F-box protein [Striga hermonthica]